MLSLLCLSLTSFSENNSESENKVIDDAEKTNLVFTFIAEYKTAVVEGVKDSSIAEVKIPSKVEFEGNIYMVTEIGWNVFFGNRSLTSI